MPPAEGAHELLYVSHEDEFEATLDYKRIGPPVLRAGVRQRSYPPDATIKLQRQSGRFELGGGQL